jgi:hypothetical protein
MTSFEECGAYAPNVVRLVGLYQGISHLAGRCECNGKLGNGRSSAGIGKQKERWIEAELQVCFCAQGG